MWLHIKLLPTAIHLVTCLHMLCIYAGCPCTVRSDYGTENCYLAATHIALRDNQSRVYRYGKSTTNTVG